MGRFCFQVLALVTLLLILDDLPACFCRNSTSMCLEHERKALLQLRQTLSDPSGLLSSWKGEDCCRWKGVTCDRSYAHVIELQLLPEVGRYHYGNIGPEKNLSVAGKLNSSLLNLRYLNRLDLSGINFKRERIPAFLGSMKQLRYLNLSIGNFHGTVPQELGNLTELEVLDLHDGFFGNLVVDDTQWVSHLQSLNYLDMSYLMIARARDLMQMIGMLPSLSRLSLSTCGLLNFHLSSIRLANSTSLVHFRYLDLSYNFLEGPIVNAVFQNMTSLQHLDLSWNELSGITPSSLGQLSSLTSLDLSWNQLSGTIPSSLGQLSSLTSLYLSANQLSGTIPSSLNQLSSLTSLNLSANQLSGTIPSSLGQLSSLTSLDLSKNELSGIIPSSLGQLLSLTSLDLSENELSGIIPSSLGQLSSLTSLDLSWNQLSGTIPSSLGQLSSLTSLDLSKNQLSGIILSSLSQLLSLTLLDLFENQLSGTIPSSLGQLSSLAILDLSWNQFSGNIPASLGHLRALQSLRLSGNHLNGTIPDDIWKLSHLSDLGLSSNSLGGVISEIHFSNLARLKYLDVSDNNLTFKAEHGWIPPFQLYSISMDSCKIGTTFPLWMQTQVDVEEISLSNASIFGALPKWLGNMTFSLLDLSHNQITGPMPNMSSECLVLDLSHNFISGPLPTNIGGMHLEFLFLNDNHIDGTLPSSLCEGGLSNLNLGNNLLSGSIPNCSERFHSSNLTLPFNKSSGLVPSSIGSSYQFSALHLNGNHLNGELPLALSYCTTLRVLDLGGNNLSGSIPTWLSKSFSSLQILRLRENSFTGSIPLQLCSLLGLQILDLAANNLTGTVPRCLGYMKGMKLNKSMDEGARSKYSIYNRGSEGPDWTREHVEQVIKGIDLDYTTLDLQLMVNLDLSCNKLVGPIPGELTLLSGLRGLNLSRNFLSGGIPTMIGDMKSLESLDLSNNRLSGTIPQSFSAFTSLSKLNLSHNNFTGPIPRGNQIQTLDDPSIYADNPLLCGDPLQKKCPGVEAPQALKEDNIEEGKLDKVMFYVVIMLGFAIGFWGVVGSLVYKKNWRRAYFNYADRQIDMAYVIVAVKLAELRRRLRGA